MNIIEKCQSIKNLIFLNIDKFIIKEDDFFNREETENYKLFKGLVDKKLLSTKQEQEYSYISQTMKIILPLQIKIQSSELIYKDIIVFFQENNEKLKEELKNRFLYIFEKQNENQVNEYFEDIKKKINEIKMTKENLEITLKFFSDYLNDSHKGDIDKIENLIDKIKNSSINLFYEQKTKNEIKSFEKYFDKAKSVINRQKSIFFNETYKYYKTYANKSDKELLELVKKEFKNFKYLFNENKINKIDNNLLIKCLRPFLKKGENEIKKELEIIIDILDIRDVKNNNEILKDLLYILNREYISNTVLAIRLFIKITKCKRTDFSQGIEDIIEKLKEKKDIVINIGKCKKMLNELNLNIDEKDNTYIDILINLKEKPDTIQYLFKTTTEDCNNLRDLATQDENSFVLVNDILELEKCIEFFKNLGKLEEMKTKNDKEIINKLKKNVQKKKDISISIKKFVNNYDQIKMLKFSLNQTDVLRNQIQSILNESTFTLSNSQNTFKWYCIIENQTNQYNKDYLISLRERVQLSKKITDDYKYFMERIEEIFNISNILEEIYKKGYPKNIVVNVNIKKNNNIKDIKKYYIINYEYMTDNKSELSYNEIVNNLKNIFFILKEKQMNAYIKKPLIRYIYGCQFNYLYNFFYNNDKTINHFLKYITNDLYQIEVDNFKPEEKDDIIESNINNYENYIKKLLENNNLNLKKIYDNTFIKQINNNEKYQGIFIYNCEILEKDLYQIYKYMTGYNPIAQNILICNKDITIEEIESFLYRSILCEFNSCFIMAGIELLDTDQKEYVIDLLNKFFPKGDEKINSCLILLYTSKSSDIYKSLDIQKYKKILNLKIYMIIQLLNK